MSYPSAFPELDDFYDEALRRGHLPTVDPPMIRLFFDDMTTPIMTADDVRFEWGYIGFGSFDDTGRIDNIRITAPQSRTGKAGF